MELLAIMRGLFSLLNGKYIIRMRVGKKMRSGYLTDDGKEVWND